MSNVIELPKRNKVGNIIYQLETTILEDGSIWYRIGLVLKDKVKWDEWKRMEE
nr:MAG TPA: hypothetical protein [Caudoviricetes sp.]